MHDTERACFEGEALEWTHTEHFTAMARTRIAAQSGDFNGLVLV